MMVRFQVIIFIVMICAISSLQEAKIEIEQTSSTKQYINYSFNYSDLQKNITWLYNRLNTFYWAQDTKYKLLSSWEHTKGLYKSAVHMNTLDKKNSNRAALLQKKFEIDDINMFVTSFVLYGLLQADQLETININDHRFSESLITISGFRDKNVPFGTPQYVFWPQTLVNGTWSAKPSNLIHFVQSIPQAPKWSSGILAKLGLSILTYFKMYQQVFIIPADNDDSSVNLALLGYLKELNSTHYPFWNSLNYNKMKYYQNAIKYAYRPFDSNYSLNPEANQIDPRTYYNYRKFIMEKKQQAIKKGMEPSLILPTTWLLNKKEQVKGVLLMPFGTNNVDATVSANFIFGLSYQYFTDQITLTPQLEQMLLDTTDLIVYVVQNLIEVRPDIVLVYYPSKYDFYWFVSRIVGLLKRQEHLPYPFDQVYYKLNPLMKNLGTAQILKHKISTGGKTYWNQFLGNYANKVRNEDALFSTALALNALLDTWTYKNKNTLTYDEDIPTEVLSTIRQAILFLSTSLKKNMKEQNAFFSGSIKNIETYPTVYPSNIHKNQKGQNIDPQTANIKDVSYFDLFYFKGTVSNEEYQRLLKLKWFGYDVPQTFNGYNEGKGITFPYWSSEPITQIMMITSISKFIKAQQPNISDQRSRE